jgi:hypothetical protein
MARLVGTIKGKGDLGPFGKYPRFGRIGEGMFGRMGRQIPYVSHMPKGASQSPKGDIGGNRVKEADAQRGFKNHGGVLSAPEAFGSRVGTPGSMGERSYMGDGKPSQGRG